MTASSVMLERQGTILSWPPGSRAYADRASLASLRAPTLPRERPLDETLTQPFLRVDESFAPHLERLV
jgi:hypothetical protein